MASDPESSADNCSSDEDSLNAAERTDSSNSEDDEKVHGVSSVQTTLNDIKNIVGEVMFSLAHALSLGTGIVPGICLTVAMAMLLGYTSSMLGRAGAATTGECNFTGICEWAQGPTFARFVVAVVAMKTTITCIAFSIITKMSFTEVFRSYGAGGILSQEIAVLMLFAILVILPLILRKDLGFLSYFSLIGITGELFALFVIILRCVDGSYRKGGIFFEDLPPEKRPEFGDGVNMWGVSANTIILAANLALSFNGAHYNAPKYFNLLRNKTVQRWNIVTASAFTAVVCMYMGAMLGGYLTFGDKVEGFVLLSYSNKDQLANVARIGVGSGVLMALPLAFTSCRDNWSQLLRLPRSKRYFYQVTFALFIPIIFIASMTDGIGPVNSIGGAIFGSLITLIIPGLIARFAGKRLLANTAEHIIQLAIVALGVAIMCFGTYQAILKVSQANVEHKKHS